MLTEVHIMRKTLSLFVILSAGLLFAQESLTNDSVLKLVKAGMGDELIVNMINSQPGTYTLSTDDLIALKTGGASEKVISAMVLKKSGGTPAPAAPAPPAAGPVSEVGVYYRKAGVWTDMDPEVINFKTGGVMKSIATNGIVKGDINGNIKGPHSKLELTTPVELLVYVPEGTAITEYQLLLLHVNSDNREFRTVTGGVFHKSGGASRDAQEFEGKKIAPRTYSISLPALKGGEYGLLPPSSGDATGSSGRLGKLYTFHLLE
jgi:hypothetical protein